MLHPFSPVVGLWAAWTIRQHDTLIYLLALTAFVGGLGRVLSITKAGLPKPHGLWIGYLVPELVVPWVIIAAMVVAGEQGVS